MTPRARLEHAVRPLLNRLLGPISNPSRLGWTRYVPLLPAPLRRIRKPSRWPSKSWRLPPSLRGVPGVRRSPPAERRAFEEEPLHSFFQVHWEATAFFFQRSWDYLIPAAPRLMRSIEKLRGALRANKRLDRADAEATRGRSRRSPAELSEAIRSRGLELGLSDVGFAAYDPKYTFAEFAEKHERGSVVVCAFEQDFEATQTAPSARAERAAMLAYAELNERCAALAEFIQELGFKAQPHGVDGEAIVIHYGVEAGLGQLGVNGQLLTPAAGSRARLTLITTNSELAHDEPADYGVEAICDSCQACVRRCPVGAIPKKRKEHRGVVKAKIKTERCFPVVAQVDGCAICMKVCPAQRYGLEALARHFEETGEILGKETDELEGFRWPLDGRRYGPSSNPRIDSSELIRPEGWIFDGSRTQPRQERPDLPPH